MTGDAVGVPGFVGNRAANNASDTLMAIAEPATVGYQDVWTKGIEDVLKENVAIPLVDVRTAERVIAVRRACSVSNDVHGLFAAEREARCGHVRGFNNSDVERGVGSAGRLRRRRSDSCCVWISSGWVCPFLLRRVRGRI